MHRFSIENFSRTNPGLGAGRATQYLTRTGEFAGQNANRGETMREDAQFQIEHMTGDNFPEGHRNDLRHVEVNNLPSWAQGDPGYFFRAAEKYERGGLQRGGRFYSIMELSLPRELPRAQQLELSRNFVQAILPDKVNFWVLHEPMAKDGPQPHIHIMFSARHIGDGSKGEREFFTTPQAVHPERGGFGKDRFFNQQDTPGRLRLAWTDLTNMALERAGVDRRVTADPLHKQGLQPLYVYQQPGDYRQRDHSYAPRTPEEKAQQQAYAAQQWDTRKQAVGLAAPVDLEAFGRLVREGKHVPRMRGREESSISQDDLMRRWELPLIGNKKSLIYHTYEHKNYGDVHPKNQVRFWTEQEAQDAGYRRAVNEHYGRGSGQAMTIEQATQRLREMQGKYGRQQGLAALLKRSAHVIDKDAAGGSLRIQLSQDKDQRNGLGW